MLIVAFSPNTSKIIPRILCRAPRHCAPIIYHANRFIMLQFVQRDYIAHIATSMRGIRLLHAAGWRFFTIKRNVPFDLMQNRISAKTCVDLTLRIIGIHAPFIWTPRALYRYLYRNQARLYCNTLSL